MKKISSIPSTEAKDILRVIKKKGTVKREDFSKILKLDPQNQEFVLNHISERRKNLLMKHLSQIEEDEEIEMHFELSRRESYQSSCIQMSQENNEIDFDNLSEDNQKVVAPAKINSPWIKDLKNQHKVFNFSSSVPIMSRKKSEPVEKKVEALYHDEKDPISQLIKKILYAEGDYINQSPEIVKYIKSQLTEILTLFVDQKKLKKAENKRKEKQQRKDSEASSVESFDYGQNSGLLIDFSMLYYVFDKILQKYFRIKKNAVEAQKTLKALDDSEDSAQVDEPSWEFEQPVDIIDKEEITKNLKWYLSAKLQKPKNDTKNYNQLSVKDVLKRMQDSSSSSSSSPDDSPKKGEQNLADKISQIQEQQSCHMNRVSQILNFYKGGPLISDDLEKIKNNYQCKRADQMTLEEYQQFELCRQSNFLSRGKKVFNEFICIKKENQTKQEFGRNMESIAYILRHIIKSVVELSILNRESGDVFLIPQSQIQKQQYENSLEVIVGQIKAKIGNYRANLESLEHFMVEKKENAREAFASWQSMKKTEKCDYICRVMAEKCIEQNPESWLDLSESSENYYLMYLKDQKSVDIKPKDFQKLYEKWKIDYRKQ